MKWFKTDMMKRIDGGKKHLEVVHVNIKVCRHLITVNIQNPTETWENKGSVRICVLQMLHSRVHETICNFEHQANE